MLKEFDRQFFGSADRLTYIGSGELGGKAGGLVYIRDFLERDFDPQAIPQIEVSIPIMTVITTDMFDKFMERNDLYEVASSDARDDQIALAFQQASLPVELVGDLRALISKVHQPLAIRSSSLLEDTVNEPFAGVYSTKMIPNNQPDPDVRFQKLVEAIKFVYSSTYFKSAKNYSRATSNLSSDEKMAVIIQEVVGCRFGNRFYPHVSGVARSYNFYPSGHAKPEDGVVNLALGLGKTVVDGGKCWIYSPAYPRTNPPYKSISDMLKQTQTSFWAVNMGKPPAFDPIHETEYLVEGDLHDAEVNGSLYYTASTYDPQNDKLTVGTGLPGPRVLTIAPSLMVRDIPLNNLLKNLLELSENALQNEVEIEFALSLHPEYGLPARLGFLQVRPMSVSDAKVEVTDDELSASNALVASKVVIGNGTEESISDIVYVKPQAFDAKNTNKIASDLIEFVNRLADDDRKYMLITLGRLGTTDPWMGVPVEFSEVAGAKVIVESTAPGMNVELSQGSHFFHNIIGMHILYFTVQHTGDFPVKWDWLDRQASVVETDNVRHVRLASPLLVKVDGRAGRGVVLV